MEAKWDALLEGLHELIQDARMDIKVQKDNGADPDCWAMGYSEGYLDALECLRKRVWEED